MFEEKMIVEDGANGAIPDVLICPVGKFVGSNAKGEPVPQNFTQESLEAIATSLNQTGKEILCDADHASAKEGLERNTRAVGWFSKFVANAKGLFGLLKLTKWGRELISNREYRSVSPVFSLNEEAEPTALLSVASTNTPAIRVPENVILNAEPEQSNSEVSDKSEVLHMDITKEELVELIKSTFTAMNSKTTTCDNDSSCEDEKVAVNQGNEPNKPSVPVKPSEPAGDETKTEVVPEETPEEPPPEEPKVEDPSKKAEDEKTEHETKTEPEVASAKAEEVIKEEVLNSAPTTTVPPVSENEEWRNLKGEAFRDWCSKHAEFCRNYKGE